MDGGRWTNIQKLRIVLRAIRRALVFRLSSFVDELEVTLLELPKVAGRVPQPIRMIDPQASYHTLGQQPQHQAMCRLEHLCSLHSDRGQVVDIEEAPVVD